MENKQVFVKEENYAEA